MKKAALLLLVIVGLAPAFAQQTPPPAPPPTPPPAQNPQATPSPTGLKPLSGNTGAPLVLPLRDAVVRALENNLDIAVARLDPQINQELVIEAESAFDTTLDASAEYGRTKSELTNPSHINNADLSAALTKATRYGGLWRLGWIYGDQFASGNDSANATLSLAYSQSLLRNWGVEINETAIRQAANNQKISEEALRTRILDTVQNVESAYWDLVGIHRQYDVAVSSLDLAKDFLRQTKIRVDVGTLPPIEITTAEAEVASREEAVIVAENLIRTAEDNLRALIRVTRDSLEWQQPIKTTDEPGFAAVPIETDKWITTALERRPEIVSAGLVIKNAELSERYRENQVRPDLRVGGSYRQSGNNIEGRSVLIGFNTNGQPIYSSPDVKGPFEPIKEQFTTLNNYGWSVGASFTYPLGNRAAKSAYARSKMATQQARLQYDAAIQAIIVEVRTAGRDVESAAQRVATTRANSVLQRKKVDAEQKRYENGLSTAFQVLTFQNDLRSAESAEITAIMDYNRALTRLARVRGTLLEDRGIKM